MKTADQIDESIRTGILTEAVLLSEHVRLIIQTGSFRKVLSEKIRKAVKLSVIGSVPAVPADLSISAVGFRQHEMVKKESVS